MVPLAPVASSPTAEGNDSNYLCTPSKRLRSSRCGCSCGAEHFARTLRLIGIVSGITGILGSMLVTLITDRASFRLPDSLWTALGQHVVELVYANVASSILLSSIAISASTTHDKPLKVAFTTIFWMCALQFVFYGVSMCGLRWFGTNFFLHSLVRSSRRMLWLSIPVGITGRVHKLLIPALATVISATVLFRICAVSGGVVLFELADPAITLARYGTRTATYQLGFTVPSHAVLFALLCVIIVSSAITEAVALEPMIRLKDSTVNVAKWMRGIQICVVSLDLLRFLYPVVGIGADGIYSVQYLNCVVDNATGLLSVIALVTVLHVCLSQSRAVRLAEEQANHQRELAESRSSLIRWGFHELRVPFQALLLGVNEIEHLWEQEHPAAAAPAPANAGGASGSSGGEPSTIRETLGFMKDAALTMSRILDDVLLMQKLNAGKVSIVVGSVNVRAVLTAACRQIGVTCRERNLTVIEDIASDVPETIDADQQRILQILNNFTSNAAKYARTSVRIRALLTYPQPVVGADATAMRTSTSTSSVPSVLGWLGAGGVAHRDPRPGPTSAAVRPATLSRAGSGSGGSMRSLNNFAPGGATATAEPVALTFEVEDDGCGINEADQARLFQPFVQITAGLAHKDKGTGLGLCICRQLAELHGGSVDMSSRVGTGSTFRLHLPMGTRRAANTGATTKSSSEHATGVLDASSGAMPPGRSSNRSSPAASTISNVSEPIAIRPRVARPTLQPLSTKSDKLDHIGLQIATTDTHSLGHIPTLRLSKGASNASDGDTSDDVGSRSMPSPAFAVAAAGAASAASPTPASSFPTPSRTPPAPVCVASGHGVAQSKLRVLVVDDAVSNRLLLTRALARQCPHMVLEGVDDGDECIDLVRANLSKFHVILLDHEMKRVNGTEAALALRAMGCKAIIIGVTGNAFPGDIACYMKSGLDALVTKPVDAAHVSILMHALVAHQVPALHTAAPDTDCDPRAGATKR